MRGLQCGEEEKEEEGEGDSSSGIKLTESADSTPVHRPVPLKSKSDSMLPVHRYASTSTYTCVHALVVIVLCFLLVSHIVSEYALSLFCVFF